MFEEKFSLGETRVVIKTDLQEALKTGKESLSRNRMLLETYLSNNQGFKESLEPVEPSENMPRVVRLMAESSQKAGVGPMGAVAGALAELAADDMREQGAGFALVENGGDMQISAENYGGQIKIHVYSGHHQDISGLCMVFEQKDLPLGVCTSSGKVGHSMSLGSADSVTIVSESAALSDATATAVANQVKGIQGVQQGLDQVKQIPEIQYALIIAQGKAAFTDELKEKLTMEHGEYDFSEGRVVV